MPIAKRILEATREFGAPSDWNNEPNSQPCGTLTIRDVSTPQGNFMISAWEFTPEEIERLKNGETLKLWICGSIHPVIALTVGAIQE